MKKISVKNGNVEEALAVVEENEKQTRDLILNPKNMKLNENNLNLVSGGIGKKIDMPLNDWSFTQLLRRTGNMGKGIRYFKELRKNNQFALINNNFTNQRELTDGNLFVRVAEDKGEEYIRAVLSDSYSRFDNSETIRIVKSGLEKAGVNYKLETWNNKGKTMYGRVVFPDLSENVSEEKSETDILRAGIIFMNSEVGASGVRIMPVVYRLVCSNGLISVEHEGSKKKYYQKHRFIAQKDMYKWAKEAITLAIEEAKVGIQQMKKMKKIKIEDVEKEMKEIRKEIKLAEKYEEKAIERYNSQWQGDNSLYALVNCYTNVAKEFDPKEKTKIEKSLGDVMNKRLEKSA